jgi:hypothetical protein
MQKYLYLLITIIISVNIFSLKVKFEYCIDFPDNFTSAGLDKKAIIWLNNDIFLFADGLSVYLYNIKKKEFDKIFWLDNNEDKGGKAFSSSFGRNINDTVVLFLTKKGNREYYMFDLLENNFIRATREEIIKMGSNFIIETRMYKIPNLSMELYEIDLLNNYLFITNIKENWDSAMYGFEIKNNRGKILINSDEIVKDFMIQDMGKLTINPIRNRIIAIGTGKKDKDDNYTGHRLWLFHIIYDSRVIKDNAILYQEADKKSKELLSLKKNDKIDIYEVNETGNMYTIKTNNGVEGWIFEDDIYVEKPFIRLSKDIKRNNWSMDVKTYYKPTVDSLRLREEKNTESGIIRTLIKGEKLEFIGKGKEEIINKVKGNWLKVKTAQGEIGWCFDAYLEEVKN